MAENPTADEVCQSLVDDFNATEQKALDILYPGVIFRVYQKPNPNHGVYHVRAIVDGDMVVCRIWSARRQSWSYGVKDAYCLGLLVEAGNLVVIGRDKE